MSVTLPPPAGHTLKLSAYNPRRKKRLKMQELKQMNPQPTAGEPAAEAQMQGADTPSPGEPALGREKQLPLPPTETCVSNPSLKQPRKNARIVGNGTSKLATAEMRQLLNPLSTGHRGGREGCRRGGRREKRAGPHAFPGDEGRWIRFPTRC